MHMTFNYFNLIQRFKKLDKFCSSQVKHVKFGSCTASTTGVPAPTPIINNRDHAERYFDDSFAKAESCSVSTANLILGSDYYPFTTPSTPPQTRNKSIKSSSSKKFKAPKEHIRLVNGYERFE